MEISFIIPGAAVPKGRPRVMRNGMTFTPKKTVDGEKVVKKLAMIAMQGKPLMEGALVMEYVVTIEVPESWPKKKRSEAFLGSIHPVTRPDLDNYAKLVLDALNDIVYKDDSQVVEMHLCKKYGGEVGSHVRVRHVENKDDLFGE